MPKQNPVLAKYRVDHSQVQNSKKWFDSQVANLRKGNITANKLLSSGNLTFKVTPGSLYFFFYDPKFKDTLPYYDQFPMVFPYKAIPGGFLGLNMHYLGYKERFALFNKLIDINSTKLDSTTKIKYSWGMINSMSQLHSAKACIKHYLNDHIASPFMKVDSQDWTTCMLLPVEKFVGASKDRVWKESRNI